MSLLSAAANDEDGDDIKNLRAENEQLRKALIAMHDTLEMTARAGASYASANEVLRDTVIRWASRAEQAEDMLEAIGAGGVGKLEQPQVEPQPVAWMYDWTPVGSPTVRNWVSLIREEVYDPRNGFFNVRPLYPHPQNLREPLTEEQIEDIDGEILKQGHPESHTGMLAFARAIERAHGVGSEE